MTDHEAYLDDAYEWALMTSYPARVTLLDGDYGRSKAYMTEATHVVYAGGTHDGEVFTWDEALELLEIREASLGRIYGMTAPLSDAFRKAGYGFPRD